MPALPLGLAWPTTKWALIEANGRRARFLVQAVALLELAGRVEVWGERAEVLGRDPDRRGGAQLVTARSFAPPAVTAECGAPFLQVGGRLLVSEPPEGREWPEERLAQLGLRVVERKGSVGVLEQVQSCADRFPRRVPGKRPLF